MTSSGNDASTPSSVGPIGLNARPAASAVNDRADVGMYA